LQFIADSGCRLVACDEKASKLVYQVDLTGPVAIIMGDEGEGIHEKTLERCHEQVKIPMEGKTASLNVSVASGMILSEVMRQSIALK
jgi:23S rRNA (guanosine2251-2'-O)-methyltransferase